MGWFSGKKLSQEKAQELLLTGALASNLEKIDRALEAGADIDYRYLRYKPTDSIRKEVKYSKIGYYSRDTVLSVVLDSHRHRQQSNEERESTQEFALELLKRGADPLALVSENQSPTSPIGMAAILGMDKFIAAAAAQCPSEDVYPIVTEALFHTENIQGMQALIAAGADINAELFGKSTPLYWHWCSSFSCETWPYIHALLDAGADIYARSSDGELHRDTIMEWGASQPEGKKRLDELVTEHTNRLQERLACEPGAGIDPQRLIQDGKPTTELLNYCGAHMLPELFTEHRWKGKSGAALALFEEVRAAIPDYYKPTLEAIDLTPLRRGVTQKEDGPAVARYVRNRPPPEAERC